MATKIQTWENRIIGHGVIDPAELLANPNNWRIHPDYQQRALRGVLGKIGWVQSVIVNQRTGFVVDGHMRVALALRHEQKEIPVSYIDVSEEEEEEILASFDPIGAAAVGDAKKLGDLLERINPDPQVQRILKDLAEDNKIYDSDLFPDIPEFDEGGSDADLVKIMVLVPNKLVYELTEFLDKLKFRGARWQRKGEGDE